MIDSIGAKPTDRKVSAVTRVAAPAQPAGATKQAAATAAPTVAAQLATAAPVDAQRVQDIKQAIAEGRYPLSPTKIADALIAARYEWMSHDKA
jgi:negative regulator of flagellin synthesis FlgM